MTARPTVALFAASLLLALGTSAGPARADAFLLKGGGRVYGQVVERWSDADATKWLRLKAAFGTISIPERRIAKRLKTKAARNVVRLEEALVHGLTGHVERSSDGGETWRLLRFVAAEGETSADREFPIRLAPGDRVRTGEDSGADLDVGYGLVRLAAESEVELTAAGEPTLSVLGGRAGVRVDEKTGKREFRVETPQASLGVRGTAFVVDVTGQRTRVVVGEGVVRIARSDLEAGAAATVGEDGEPVVDTSGMTSDDADFLAALRDGSLFPRIDWVVVGGGTFTMGVDREATANTYATTPTVEVTVPTFLISRTEITVAQYDAFRKWVGVYGEASLRPAGSDARQPLAPPSKERADPPVDPREPALVAWVPAAAFAAFAGGRLASEAEWEWTALQGSGRDYPWGDDAAPIFDHAWVGVNSGDRLFEQRELSIMMERGEDAFAAMREARCRTHPVGGKLPAPSGAYDLIGNAAEWCADMGEDGLDGVPRDGTPRRTGSRRARVTRGWAFGDPSAWQATTRRTGNAETGRSGIRVVVRFSP